MLSNFSCFSFSPFICFPFSLVPVDRQVSDYSCICVTIPGVFETSGVVIIIDILTYGVIVFETSGVVIIIDILTYGVIVLCGLLCLFYV